MVSHRPIRPGVLNNNKNNFKTRSNQRVFILFDLTKKIDLLK